MKTYLPQNAKWFGCFALLFAMLLGSAFAMQESPEKDVAIDGLVVQLKKTMEGRRNYISAQYKDGRLQYSEMLTAENGLLNEELRVITDRDERIAALEKRLHNCTLLEERMVAQLDVADASAVDLLKAKCDRLIAQIELKRELD